MSYCLQASCLAHRERVFWHPWFKAWLHTACNPCEALAGEADPTALYCGHCGRRTEMDGGGRLWTHEPGNPGHWDTTSWPHAWHDGKWSDLCLYAPSGAHDVLCGSQAKG